MIALALSACADPASVRVRLDLEDLAPAQVLLSVRHTSPDGQEVVRCALDAGQPLPADCPFEAGAGVWSSGPLEFVLYGAPKTQLWLTAGGTSEAGRGQATVPLALPELAGAGDTFELRVSEEASERFRCEAQAPTGSKATLIVVPGDQAGPPELLGVLDDQLQRWSLSGDQRSCELAPAGAPVALDCPLVPETLVARRESGVLLLAGLCEARDSVLVGRWGPGGLTGARFSGSALSAPLLLDLDGSGQVAAVVIADGEDGEDGEMGPSLHLVSTQAARLGQSVVTLPLRGVRRNEAEFAPQLAAFVAQGRGGVVVSGLYGRTALVGVVQGRDCTSSMGPLSYCELRRDLRLPKAAPTFVTQGQQSGRAPALVERVEGALVLTLLIFDEMSGDLLRAQSAEHPLDVVEPAGASGRVVVGFPDGLEPTLEGAYAVVPDGQQAHLRPVFIQKQLDPLPLKLELPPESARVLIANVDGKDGEELLVYGRGDRLSLFNGEGRPLNTWWPSGEGPMAAVLFGEATGNTGTTRIAALRSGMISVIGLGPRSYVRARFSWPMTHRQPTGIGLYTGSVDPLQSLP